MDSLEDLAVVDLVDLAAGIVLMVDIRLSLEVEVEADLLYN